MTTTGPPDVARSALPVLWSVALSRLVLGVLALVLAVRWHVPDPAVTYADPAGLTAELTVRYGPDWSSRLAAVVLLVVWVGLEATSRLDPGWRRTVRRRRMTARRPVGPDLATPATAQVTGVAAGTTALAAALLLVAEPLPNSFGDLTYPAASGYLDELGRALDLGPVPAVEAVALVLLVAGLLTVGTPAAVGRTLLAAAAAGLTAGLVTAVLVDMRLYGLGLQHVLGIAGAWLLVLLAAGALAATPVWQRLRRPPARVLRRRPRPARAGLTPPASGAAPPRARPPAAARPAVRDPTTR